MINLNKDNNNLEYSLLIGFINTLIFTKESRKRHDILSFVINQKAWEFHNNKEEKPILSKELKEAYIQAYNLINLYQQLEGKTPDNVSTIIDRL